MNPGTSKCTRALMASLPIFYWKKTALVHFFLLIHTPCAVTVLLVSLPLELLPVKSPMPIIRRSQRTLSLRLLPFLCHLLQMMTAFLATTIASSQRFLLPLQ